MYSTQHFTPLLTIFGNSYVAEQYADETHHFPPDEPREFVVNFEEMFKKLRAALSPCGSRGANQV